MIDFSTLQGLTIPEGVVVQIEDASGRVLWAAVTTKPVVLEVEKQTLTTYAGGTQYADEEFILFDIYPKTNGTVKVTYGGLTKTITDTSGAEEPNAQQVFFGTFNGVADEVATPASGELVIEGDYKSFSVGNYSSGSKGITAYCGCITEVNDWGDVVDIPNLAFCGCESLTSVVIPDGVTSIGSWAFSGCTSLTSIEIPDGVTSISDGAFSGCNSLTSIDIPNRVRSIGAYAFQNCNSLSSIVIPDSVTSIGQYSFCYCTGIATLKLSNGITVIPNNAFGDWIALREVTIPESVTEIGVGAFTSTRSGADSLTVTMLSTTPPTLEEIRSSDALGTVSRPFAWNGKVRFIVPKGYGDTYKTANVWSVYAYYITEAE